MLLFRSMRQGASETKRAPGNMTGLGLRGLASLGSPGPSPNFWRLGPCRSLPSAHCACSCRPRVQSVLQENAPTALHLLAACCYPHLGSVSLRCLRQGPWCKRKDAKETEPSLAAASKEAIPPAWKRSNILRHLAPRVPLTSGLLAVEFMLYAHIQEREGVRSFHRPSPMLSSSAFWKWLCCCILPRPTQTGLRCFTATDTIRTSCCPSED